MSNHYTYSYRVYPKRRLITRSEIDAINKAQIDNNLRTIGRYEYYLNKAQNCYDIRFMNDGGNDSDKRFFENIALENFHIWKIHHDYDGGAADILYQYDGAIYSECALYNYDKIVIKGNIINPEKIYALLFDHWSYKNLRKQGIIEQIPNDSLTVNRIGHYSAYNGVRCKNNTFESPIEVGLDHFTENSYSSDVAQILTTYSFKLIRLYRSNQNSTISDEVREIQFIYNDRIVQQFHWHANNTSSQIGRNWWDNLKSPKWVEFKTKYNANIR